MSSSYHPPEFHNGVVQALLTDYYQITMAYAYWKNGKMNEHAVFELYFRKNPFRGEFTIFAGLEQCIKFVRDYKFTDEDIEFLQSEMPDTTDPGFFQYLRTLTTEQVTLHAIPEGTVVFPKEPLIVVEGPLAVVQLLETTLLNLVNFASLVTTNAARFRIAAGKDKMLLEFGLRRAQGPDGGMSASKYCYIGGFDGTSNVLAAKHHGIPAKGTHAHAYVSSFDPLEEEVQDSSTAFNLQHLPSGEMRPFFHASKEWLKQLAEPLNFGHNQTNPGEFRAFVEYALSFPTNFLALVDTYNVLKSGILNFCAVALALHDFGYKPTGIRLDSGDLAYLSKEVRKVFKLIARVYNLPWFSSLMIVASNDINEATLYSLEQQGHEINSYGIGTHLVTCQKQPALGCVFKLVEICGAPRMKLSEDVNKVTIPGKKSMYRLYSADGSALLDLMTQHSEEAPAANDRVLCRHLLQEAKRVFVRPTKVERLLKTYWKNGKMEEPIPTLQESRARVQSTIKELRPDHLRNLNPTPYKVSVTNNLYNFMRALWMDCAPISELE